MNAATIDGIALLDKPQGITSHDAVARLRRALGTKKVGHAGTLDPMATGLLILGVGPSTRLLTHLVGLDKTYEATIRLGETTTTDDAEGDRVAVHDTSATTDAAIAAGIAALTGDLLQRPSSVSAIKVDGVRAYVRVRAGEDVELAARPVTIHEFDERGRRRFRREEAPSTGTAAAGAGRPAGEGVDLDVVVRCTSGTYIRALARDLGEALGVGGHLTRLRRTRVGPWDVADAVPVPAWWDGTGDRPAIPLAAPAGIAARLFPTLPLSAEQAADLRNGKRLQVEAPDAATAAALAPDGRLVGLVEVARGRTRVLTNFPVEQ